MKLLALVLLIVAVSAAEKGREIVTGDTIGEIACGTQGYHVSVQSVSQSGSSATICYSVVVDQGARYDLSHWTLETAGSTCFYKDSNPKAESEIPYLDPTTNVFGLKWNQGQSKGTSKTYCFAVDDYLEMHDGYAATKASTYYARCPVSGALPVCAEPQPPAPLPDDVAEDIEEPAEEAEIEEEVDKGYRPEPETLESEDEESNHEESNHEESNHEESNHEESNHEESNQEESNHEESNHEESNHEESNHDDSGSWDHSDSWDHEDTKTETESEHSGDESSSGGGDPHFVGFNGEGFDFMGIPGKIYNLFSSFHLQVNAHFAKTVVEVESFKGQAIPKGLYALVSGNSYLTLMDEIGITIVGDVQIFFSVNGTATINGNDIPATGEKIALTPCGKYWMTMRDTQGEAIAMDIPEEYVKLWYGGEAHVVSRIAKLHLHDFDLLVKIAQSPRLPGVTFVDVNFFPLNKNSLKAMDVNGIIGQTAQGTIAARGLESPVAGADSDYEIKSGDIFGSDFTFNRYLETSVIRSLFDQVDINGDDSIDRAEMTRFLASVSSEVDAGRVFAKADTNDDGALSFLEFVAA